MPKTKLLFLLYFSVFLFISCQEGTFEIEVPTEIFVNEKFNFGLSYYQIVAPSSEPILPEWNKLVRSVTWKIFDNSKNPKKYEVEESGKDVKLEYQFNEMGEYMIQARIWLTDEFKANLKKDFLESETYTFMVQSKISNKPRYMMVQKIDDNNKYSFFFEVTGQASKSITIHFGDCQQRDVDLHNLINIEHTYEMNGIFQPVAYIWNSDSSMTEIRSKTKIEVTNGKGKFDLERYGTNKCNEKSISDVRRFTCKKVGQTNFCLCNPGYEKRGDECVLIENPCRDGNPSFLNLQCNAGEKCLPVLDTLGKITGMVNCNSCKIGFEKTKVRGDPLEIGSLIEVCRPILENPAAVESNQLQCSKKGLQCFANTIKHAHLSYQAYTGYSCGNNCSRYEVNQPLKNTGQRSCSQTPDPCLIYEKGWDRCRSLSQACKSQIHINLNDGSKSFTGKFACGKCSSERMKPYEADEKYCVTNFNSCEYNNVGKCGALKCIPLKDEKNWFTDHSFCGSCPYNYSHTCTQSIGYKVTFSCACTQTKAQILAAITEGNEGLSEDGSPFSSSAYKWVFTMILVSSLIILFSFGIYYKVRAKKQDRPEQSKLLNDV